MNAPDPIFSGVQITTAVACGLMAGVFFAFSSFVMKALAKLPPSEGVAAMQAINVAAVRSWFLAAFLGSAVICLAAAAWASFRWSDPAARWLLAGAAIHFFGCFMVTIVRNVPMNDALAAVAPASPGASALWADYLIRWTFWNHVRTIASLVGMILVLVGRAGGSVI